MGWRGFVHIALFTLIAGAVLFFLLAPKDPFNPAEQALFDRLDGLISGGTPATDDFVEAFGLPERCRSGDCYIRKLPMPTLGNPSIYLRRGPEENIMSIDLDRVCVRTDRVTVKYRGGTIRHFCDHGFCPSYAVQSSWGIMDFDWPRKPSTCAEAVTLNTERLFRK